MSHGARAPIIIVMGVSGVGKTTLGLELASRLSIRFVDGDDLHSPSSIAKMRAGVALGDEDRMPWLREIGQILGSSEDGIVVACSALRRRYRDALRESAPDVIFLLLDGPDNIIAERLKRRKHAFMSPDLLASQRASLEPLGADEDGLVVNIDKTPDEIVRQVVAWLGEERHEV